ncbi:MAG: Y-family DNA polymerase [Shimia sp.]
MSDTDQTRRILVLWFPRLGAERLTRRAPGLDLPVAIVREVGNMRTLCSLSESAEAGGLALGQPLRDALAMAPKLVTRLEDAPATADFLGVLRRWAGKFSPWVNNIGEDALALDLSGCAHLFGGEEGLMALVEDDCARFRLTLRMGLADTLGAAWALARYAGQGIGASRTGDAIDQEAYATRSRAVKRRNWEKGGAPPKVVSLNAQQGRIAAPGQTRRAISMLPVAALRLAEDTVNELNRLGLRRIEDVLNQPRGPLVRRFGADLGRRLDQALGLVSEPISPAKAPAHFGVRLSLPDPIGLEDDLAAAIDRLLPRLCEQLRSAARGARIVRLDCSRADGTHQVIEVGLARPAAEPDRIRPLLGLKLGDVDAGFGIDRVRLTVPVHEHVRPSQTRRLPGDAAPEGGSPLDDLMGRLGARVGVDAITRLHPASSHIPEKTEAPVVAAYAEARHDWQTPPAPRPISLFPTELVDAEDTPTVPARFKWRGRWHDAARARGPERIAPEWWRDEPAWRSGTRDYWQVTTRDGAQLWLFYAHGGDASGGWFCQGVFA